MVDFTKLARGSTSDLPQRLEDTFLRLDRRTSHVDLRPIQVQTLAALDSRLQGKDSILRVSTGGGKTVVGLVFLYHLMRRDQLPSVYLVPTVQLVDQVLSEAEKIGVPARAYLAGETHPDPACTRCEAVLVCTYDKLFNGLSTFTRMDVALNPGALVLDDVHAGVEVIRKAYSVRLPDEAHRKLRDALSPLMESHAPGAWEGIRTLDASSVVEIPFWIWQSQIAAIRSLLTPYISSQELKFAWKHLADHLELCRCVMSGSGTEIAMDPPSVERVRPYASCKHRLFMSASINDGSALVRELACDPAALQEQVGPVFDSGPGERLIVATSLVDPKLHTDSLGEMCAALSRLTNVVVLVPSERIAQRWTSAGAKFVRGDHVSQAVESLRSYPKGGFYVFAQRYDGIDLPDDACRVLVLDGLPRGEGLIDTVDQQQQGHTVGVRNRLVNRLEQGLGRGVRSPADYCAVLLVGPELGQFISQRATMELLGNATRKQIEMSKEISASAATSDDTLSAIRETVLQALRRDPTWRQYYAQQMRTQGAPAPSDTRTSLIAMAVAERQAHVKALSRDFAAAAAVLQKLVNEVQAEEDTVAALMQKMAGLVFHYNESNAHEIQRKAYSKSAYVSRPIDLLPSAVAVGVNQVSRHSRWLADFAYANGAVTALHSLGMDLAFSGSAASVEDALMRLGAVLGAESSRPEKEFGRGPDVLWRFDNLAFVIEAKSERRKELPKSDAAQLRLSVDWYNFQYPAGVAAVPLVVSDAVPERKDDFGFGARLMTSAVLIDLINRLIKAASTQITDGMIFARTPDAVKRTLSDLKLLPDQIRDSCKLL